MTYAMTVVEEMRRRPSRGTLARLVDKAADLIEHQAAEIERLQLRVLEVITESARHSVEPVAVAHIDGLGELYTYAEWGALRNELLYTAPPPSAQPETVAFGYVVEHTDGVTEFCKSHPYLLDTAVSCTPVWDASPPSAQRVALTDEQIDAAMRSIDDGQGLRIRAIRTKDFRIARGDEMTSTEQDEYRAQILFARAIEAAQGITAAQPKEQTA